MAEFKKKTSDSKFFKSLKKKIEERKERRDIKKANKEKSKSTTLYEKPRYRKDATDEEKYYGKDKGILKVESKRPGKAGSGQIRTLKFTLRGRPSKIRRRLNIPLPTIISQTKRGNMKMGKGPFSKLFKKGVGSSKRQYKKRVKAKGPGTLFKLGLTEVSKSCRRWIRRKNK